METIKYVMETSDLGRLIRGEMLSLPQRNGHRRGFEIELMDNPTNGEIIMSIFKEIQHWSDGQINPSWWNAPYKKVRYWL